MRKKAQSYALLHYQATVKSLTCKEVMEGTHPSSERIPLMKSLKQENIICNPDRWGKAIIEKDMFPIKPLLRCVDNYFFNHPAVIGFFFGGVLVYFFMMVIIARDFGNCFRY